MPFPILTAAAPAIGSVLSGLLHRRGVQDQNAANSAEAQRNRDFQERMSSTAHSREVSDLRNAGLNPILSATGGAGASSPSGSLPHMENEMEGAASSAMAVRMLNEQLKQVQADTRLKNQTRATEEARTAGEELRNYILDATKDFQVEANEQSARAISLENDKRQVTRGFYAAGSEALKTIAEKLNLPPAVMRLLQNVTN